MSMVSFCNPRRHVGGQTFLVAALTTMLVLLAAAPSTATPPPHANNERTLSVMTRNVYLGASLEPLFPEPPLATPEAAVAAATQVWHQVLGTDFPARAEALADEIAATDPVLIGLQEVTLFRVGPAGDPAPATDVRLDFLEVLDDELAARGLDYRVAAVQESFDGELTAFDWAPEAGGTGTLTDVRLTDRDVILVRQGPETANVKVSNPRSGTFSAALEMTMLGQPLPILRGWTAVDVKFRGREFVFVNTHLEAFHQGIALLQADELLTTGPLADSDPAVLVGDFNSAPGEAAYERLAAAGFADAAVGGPDTCCFDANLAEESATLDTRIDLVLHRGPIEARAVQTIGAEPFSTQPPLWASDHLGVVADMVIR